jgi:transposase
MAYCEECFQKQLKIEGLQDEIKRLKEQLRYRQQKEKEGFFRSSTPSSKIPVKENTPVRDHKPKGARPGHKGKGRQKITEAEADRIEDIFYGSTCPSCGGVLTDNGFDTRGVLDMPPVKVQRIVYRLHKGYCKRCNKSFEPKAPGVMPKWLHGNQLNAMTVAMHYLHGIPMGRICEQTGIEAGALVEIFHNLAKLFQEVPQRLIEQYRGSAVKHADETGWRQNGKNGYAWLFATETISIFLFKPSRSAKVVKEILGEKPLPGVLVVDRYAGYNKAPCALQYCYSHIKREVEDTEKEFSESEEVKTFASVMLPLLTDAMRLRNQPIPDEEFYERASEVKSQITAAVQAPARHLGIRHIQDIFHDNAHRMYHWADDRKVPAENNLAERDLRPTMIARKTSFGSVSDAGAQTRSILMSVLHTLRKRKVDVSARFKEVLDQLSQDRHADPFSLLFRSDSSP